jgi:homoserine dehydrogenase
LHEGGYYIRLLALDRPGTFASIAKHLADEQISLESIVQRHRGTRPHGGDDPKSPEAPAAIILITYATTEDAVRRALKAIESQKVTAGVPQLIRIEKD